MDNPTSVLIGKPLWRCTRAADMACFQFGARHQCKSARGEDSEVGDYALHIQCSWRIIRGDEILVGREDLFQPGDPAAPNADSYFDWQKSNLQDARLKKLFINDTRQFTVVGTALRAAGELDILFDDELRLEVFPNSSIQTDNVEHWRLFSPSIDASQADKAPHFVFSGIGLRHE
jgi:hypothetical protein